MIFLDPGSSNRTSLSPLSCLLASPPANKRPRVCSQLERRKDTNIQHGPEQEKFDSAVKNMDFAKNNKKTVCVDNKAAGDQNWEESGRGNRGGPCRHLCTFVQPASAGLDGEMATLIKLFTGL